MSDIDITANGAPRSVPAGTTIAGLLEALELPPARVAVERNGRLVPRDRYGDAVLAAGDRLEVVTLVGGG